MRRRSGAAVQLDAGATAPGKRQIAYQVRVNSLLEVEIPPNVTATVRLPDGRSLEAESGKHAFTASPAV